MEAASGSTRPQHTQHITGMIEIRDRHIKFNNLRHMCMKFHKKVACYILKVIQWITFTKLMNLGTITAE